MPRSRHRVPFNLPFLAGRELEYMKSAVEGGMLAGNGPFTKRCQAWLEERFGARKVLLTHSCTAALEMAALLCDLEPGDEVILPSFTFVSTANAFLLRGARPVFVDIRRDTLNLDESLIEAAVTARTRVVAPIHYAGVGARMEVIGDIARRRRLRVVEDAAQGVNATYQGRYLGTLGDLGTWSFHETKNVISGEGGALVVQDEALIGRAEIVWEKGTDRARFFRGEVDKYTWVDLGSSYLPSELIAAFLWGQLEHLDEITADRLAVHDFYRAELAELAERGRFSLPVVPEGCQHNGHIFHLILPSATERDELLAHLNAAGVNAVFHYVPLHESPMGRRLGYRLGDLPATEELSRRLLRLPCYFGITGEQTRLVVSEVRRFCAR